jgi:signal peptidase I
MNGRIRYWRQGGSAGRGGVAALVLGVCGLLLVHAFALQPFQIPTGSMAPTLLGHHRLCTCPRCGCAFAVGRHPGDTGQRCAGCYRKAACPNCGEHQLPVADVSETRGDQILVNKTAFALRAPRRWEIAVLRLFGTFFIKRLVGLPGEEVLIRDGDLIVAGRLARKSFAQAQAMKIPVFDHDCSPAPDSWQARWECVPAAPTGGRILKVDGLASPRTLRYRHFSREQKAGPVDDEYAYNSGAHAGSELVHDFLFEANVVVRSGEGSVALRLCDGQDWVEVEVPTAGAVRVRCWAAETPAADCDLHVEGAAVAFRPGRPYHVVMALVDRRLSFAVDGVLRLSADLPEPGVRRGVTTPVELRTDGLAVEVHNFRLYRDIHYSQRGGHAVHGRPVRLEADQYFVLGDNSPHSEDSRFWADAGKITAAQLVGRPFLVHLPSRTLGSGWQVPAWSRMRWLY